MTTASLIKCAIAQSQEYVFRRRDFASVGSAAAVSRALRELVEEGVLVRLGLGVYAKAKPSALSGKPIPVRPLEVLGPQVLQKFGVSVTASRATRDYNAGRTTQVPSGIVLSTDGRRITRKIGFNGRFVQYERG